LAEPEARILEDYRRRAEALNALAATLQARARRIEWLRLTCFLALVLLAAAWFDAGRYRLLVGGLAIIAAAAFVVLVSRHRQLRARMRDAHDLAALCERGAFRIERAWRQLGTPPATPATSDHPFAHDLAVVGMASMAQLVDVVSAAPGRPIVLDWLLAVSPPPVNEIEARQQAVRELSPQVEWREQLALHGKRVRADAPARLKQFTTWAESERWLLDRRALITTGRITAVASIVCIIGLGFSPWFLVPFPAIIAINGIATLLTARRIHELLERAALRADDVASHMALVKQAKTLQPQAAKLKVLRAQLADGNAGAALVRLERILSWSEVRHNSVLYPIVQLLLLFDMHLAAALERWQAEHGARVRVWFTALGEIEAVAALATLAYENPGWTFPDFTDESAVSARGLAHPLIPYSRRVANDVEIGPPGRFLLVTGSNLAGKTTLIRAVGANAVLANAGAPVCAEYFSLPRLRVQTSMHIHDVLEEGLSLFAAELRRIRSIVDAAREPDQPPVLYLLDELLRGTNAEERRVAVATILRHLLNAGAIGAVTTHDLALASESSLEQHVVAVHFTEYFEPGINGPVMRFDYKLRPGPATSSNALALLRIMGLNDDVLKESNH
jgi:hypothetical protein